MKARRAAGTNPQPAPVSKVFAPNAYCPPYVVLRARRAAQRNGGTRCQRREFCGLRELDVWNAVKVNCWPGLLVRVAGQSTGPGLLDSVSAGQAQLSRRAGRA